MSSAAGTPSDCGGDRPWQSYHTAYANAKAGMEGVDKEKVQKMIYEMSKEASPSPTAWVISVTNTYNLGTRALAATQGAGQRSTGQLLLELCCCWSTRILSCGSISLCINRGALTSELRINFTLYQLQDQSGVAEVEPEASGVGGGDRRASAAEASPATTTSTSRRAKVDQHGGSERRSRGRSGPARRRSVVEDPLVGGRRRTRSSVAGGDPPPGRAAESSWTGGGDPCRGQRRSCSWVGSSVSQELRRLAVATRATGGGRWGLNF
ncbi:uncharacterized protein LOC125506604 [Triticum urartu]|uniref:uncharacterized protein LOC125506604 n=1 Tax=Triticum urartu TaxID=4572 RepID=UPI002042E48F|nr:uncharacterized protein LOC125506604 [Triticum urartu]